MIISVKLMTFRQEFGTIDDKEYCGNIIKLLEYSEVFIKNNSKTTWEIKGLYRNELEDYPTSAIREALVNAIIHRDYQMLGSEVHIDMFDDRLEIVSPGGMLDGRNIQDLELSSIPSLRRNVIISDIFNRLHLMERRGSGLTRIMDSYSNCREKPKFNSNSSCFSVVFPNKGYLYNNSENIMINSDINVVNNDDYFIIKMYKNLAGKVRNNYLNTLENMFKRYGYDFFFDRETIEEIFMVKKSRALEIISQLMDNDLIINIEEKKYKFKK